MRSARLVNVVGSSNGTRTRLELSMKEHGNEQSITRKRIYIDDVDIVVVVVVAVGK